MKPLAIDLCCGLGGWTVGLLAEGWSVVGFDIVKPRYFPPSAMLVLQDVRTISGLSWRGKVQFIVGSPPCTEFSQMWRFARSRTPNPQAGVELFNACKRIAQEAGCPWVLENVADARKWVGDSDSSVGPYYFWGERLVLRPQGEFRKGIWNTDKAADGSQRWNHNGGWRAKTYVRDQAQRALIPIEIARAYGRELYPSNWSADA